MTKFDCSANWRPLMVLLAISIAIGGIGGAAAQSGEAPSKPPAAPNNESKKEAPAPGAMDAPDGQAPNNTAPSGGLNVVKDPETGKLRGPDRAEAAKFGGPAINRSVEGLKPEVLPSGATVMNLQGRFQSYTVATRNSDGVIQLECKNRSPDHNHSGHETADDGEGETDTELPVNSLVKTNGK